MPPKLKFTREEIVAVALRLVSERGVESLTARELGAALGCSARPIFTAFENMEEVQKEVHAAAMRLFETTEYRQFSEMPPFKQVGMKMILFGRDEPKLYRLLFMQENKKAVSFEDVLGNLGLIAVECTEMFEKEYALCAEQAKTLFESVWIYTFGVGVLCATGVCRLTEKEIGEMLTTEFEAMLSWIKNEKEKRI